jgi:hypothetical protein
MPSSRSEKNMSFWSASFRILRRRWLFGRSQNNKKKFAMLAILYINISKRID